MVPANPQLNHRTPVPERKLQSAGHETGNARHGPRRGKGLSLLLFFSKRLGVVDFGFRALGIGVEGFRG